MTSSSRRSLGKRILLAAFFALSLCAPLSAALALDPTVSDIKYEPPRLEIPIPNVSFSQGISTDEAITLPWIAQYISGIYTFLISIVGMVAAVMIIIGGFQYLTSAGDSTKIGAAKKRITDAVIGLVLAFGSYILLYTINPNLVEFASLQLTSVKTDQYGEMYTPAVPPEITAPPGSTSSNGGSTRWCDSVKGCIPVCQSWGCGTAISKTNCDYAKMPVEGPGMINPNSSDLISPSDTAKWPVMKNVKVRDSSTKATTGVVDGLKRLNAYLGDPSKQYGGKGYTVQVNTCWRDWRGDAAKECGIVLGDHTQGGVVNHDPNAFYLAWPGSNPHSAGTACDMVLLLNNKKISAVSGAEQNCLSKRAPDQIFVDIMTGPEVGARRLAFEAWHFEWGSSYGCRCTGQACDAIFPIGTSCSAISGSGDPGC